MPPRRSQIPRPLLPHPPQTNLRLSNPILESTKSTTSASHILCHHRRLPRQDPPLPPPPPRNLQVQAPRPPRPPPARPFLQQEGRTTTGKGEQGALDSAAALDVAAEGSGGGGEERRKKNGRRGRRKDGEEAGESFDDGKEMEIAVVGCELDSRHLALAAVRKKCANRVWRQQVADCDLGRCGDMQHHAGDMAGVCRGFQRI